MRDQDRRWSGLCSNPRRANNGVKSGEGGRGVQTLPDIPGCAQSLGVNEATPPLKTIPCFSVRKWMLFNNQEVISDIPEMPFPLHT
ncbi:hypothetical protein CesoFtcFv8_009802 [Champsocephalus esox]|uniref:Uncharacterized protein n=2 Tax=Champsocephalus TaxID=52236 RepID=A0AAN8HR91_CHAGU|nr:hypothetical protein CesoFtcFv8_009802 [Champsocephalus esox]KAK5924697.1 hypothetical protein CgunFtcFv8_017287 [Champsocephalus gunnari]